MYAEVAEMFYRIIALIIPLFVNTEKAKGSIG